MTHASREELRAELIGRIPTSYLPWVHLAVPTVSGMAIAALALSRIESLTAWQLLALPLFLAFGNIVDIFIDRGFGHNYRDDSEQDRALIDLIAMLDEYLIDQGTVKPCHLVAALRKKGAVQKYGIQPRWFGRLTPEFCVRYPDP